MSRLPFVLTIILYLHGETQAKGKSVLYLEHIRQCPEPEYAATESLLTGIRLYKINRTARVLNANVTVKRPWDKDVGFQMDLDIWGYAGWTRVPYVPLQQDFCNKFRTMFSQLWYKIGTIVGVDGCPVPPGEYRLTNYTTQNSVYFPFNGRFRLRAILKSMRTKEVILCTLVLVNVEENVSN